MYQTPQPPHRAGQRRDWAEISDYGRRRSRFAWVIERRGCKEIRFSLLARDQRVADRFGDLREDRLHAGKLMSEAAERQMSMRGPGGGLMIRRARGPFVRGAAQRVRIEGVKRIARSTEQNQPPTRESELRAKGQSRGQSPQPSPKSIRSFRHLNPRLRWDHRSEQPKRRTAFVAYGRERIRAMLAQHRARNATARQPGEFQPPTFSTQASRLARLAGDLDRRPAAYRGCGGAVFGRRLAGSCHLRRPLSRRAHKA